MSIFKVIVEGRNCLLEIDGSVRLCGFFATRPIEAADEITARQVAMDTIRREISSQVRNAACDPPKLEVSEVTQIPAVADCVPSRGFTFYLEDEAVESPN